MIITELLHLNDRIPLKGLDLFSSTDEDIINKLSAGDRLIADGRPRKIISIEKGTSCFTEKPYFIIQIENSEDIVCPCTVYVETPDKV